MEVTSRPLTPPRFINSRRGSQRPVSTVRLCGETPGGPASPREAWPVVSNPELARGGAVEQPSGEPIPSSTRSRATVATPSSSKPPEPMPRSAGAAPRCSRTPGANTGWPSLVLQERDAARHRRAGDGADERARSATWRSGFRRSPARCGWRACAGSRRDTARSPGKAPMLTASGRSAAWRVERPSPPRSMPRALAGDHRGGKGEGAGRDVLALEPMAGDEAPGA